MPLKTIMEFISFIQKTIHYEATMPRKTNSMAFTWLVPIILKSLIMILTITIMGCGW